MNFFFRKKRNYFSRQSLNKLINENILDPSTLNTVAVFGEGWRRRFAK